MKKLYSLLLAMLAVGSISARQLTFYQGDTPLADGSTVVLGLDDIKVEEIGAGYRSVTMNPNLFLSTDTYSSQIKVVANCTSGQYIQLCIGGSCIAEPKVTKENLTIAKNAKESLQFEYVNTMLGPDEAIPTVTTDITAEYAGYEGTTIAIKVVMGPDASSALDNLAATGTFVKATANGLDYSLAAPGTIALYSITGTQVLAVKAEGQGSVSTHSLRPGIYIYTVTTSAGRTTGKINVR